MLLLTTLSLAIAATVIYCMLRYQPAPTPVRIRDDRQVAIRRKTRGSAR